jgi:hypothetical protein
VVQADSGNINVNARIDAQDAASGQPLVAGGTVTLTAGNNVNINETIVTNNGAVNVTATTGSVVFWNAGTDGSGNKKIMSGTAPITVTSGANFSTGTAPPMGLVFNIGTVGDTVLGLTLTNPVTSDVYNAFVAEQLKPWVTMATTGKLTLVSTAGNVSIDAPIPQTTGEIEIRAGNNVVVNEKLVNAANAPISITAGTACTLGTCNTASQGTITVNDSVSDTNVTVNFIDGGPHTASRFDGPEVDARNANLTMTAFGNISINEMVASVDTIRITSTAGDILNGQIDHSRASGTPDAVYLSAAGHIGNGSSILIGPADLVDLRTTSGSIRSGVMSPPSLTVVAGLDAELYGALGANVGITAGRDIDIRGSQMAGQLAMNAQRDILVQAMDAKSIQATAGRDAIFSPGSLGVDYASIWLNGSGVPVALSPIPSGTYIFAVKAGNDIIFENLSGISLLNAAASPIDLGVSQPAMALYAGHNVELRRLQTYGAVSITAGNSITLFNDIGPTIDPPSTVTPHYFTTDQGVASLNVSTPNTGSITMQGARAVGNATISTGSLTAAKAITAGGVRSLTAPTLQSLNDGTPIGTMAEMLRPGAVTPAIVPGPAVNAPPPPAALSALPSAAPGGFSVSGTTDPGTSALTSSTAPGTLGALANNAPGGLSVDNTSVPGISGDLEEIPLLAETTVLAATRAADKEEGSEVSGTGADKLKDGDAIPLPTTSIAQLFDFGRSGSFGPEPPPGSDEGDEERRRRR